MNPIRVPRGPGEYILIEKRSKFIGTLLPAENEKAALESLAAVRASHREASHHVFAYRLSENGTARFSDAGEPRGTAGPPVFEALRREDVVNALCVVTRYFGGVLLGAGGLTRAYAAAAKGALDAAGTVVLRPMAAGAVTVKYPLWEQLARLLTPHGARVTDTRYAGDVSVDFVLPAENTAGLEAAVSELTRGDPLSAVVWGETILGPP